MNELLLYPERHCPTCDRSHEWKANEHFCCDHCGAELACEWERIETPDGPEDVLYFERMN